MFSSWSKVSLGVVLLVLAKNVSCVPSALSVTPSSSWYGNDGTWSAVSLRVGTPQQWVDVMVSTASSETWVVSPFGCDGTNKCASERGGLFNLTRSSSWKSEGFYELGLDTQLGFNGSGEYGLDNLEFSLTGASLPESIIGSINTTEYLTGFFGLGIVPGNFSNGQFKSPIGALVETASLIPSHSYGFTAGANYQQKGEPCSLTLGGYDANRFLSHNVTFGLNPTQQPEAFLNSIMVSSPTAKSNWSSNSVQLLAPADGVYTIIDSSTPLLWLPKSVCDQFAEALGLTYNHTLQLYTFDGNPSRHDDLRTWDLTFAFSFSDTSNPGNIVNITLPYAAFDLQLTDSYIPNTSVQSPDFKKYYFPLRQATDENQYTIGRAFLQEAYMITDYERNNFSIHQAVHVSDPIGNASIIDITRPFTSQLSGPPATAAKTPQGQALSKAVKIGIAVAAAIGTLIFILLLLLYYYRHHRHQQPNPKLSENDKTDGIQRQPHRRSYNSFFHRLSCSHEIGGSSVTLSEMDSSLQQRFELPDSQVAIELESDPSTFTTTEEAENMITYERAPQTNEQMMGPREKNEVDISIEGHHRPYETAFPSPATSNSTRMLGSSSPVSPPPPTYALHSSSPGYAGPLLPSIFIPKLVGPDGATLGVDGDTIDTLGSGFTEDEGIQMGINEMLDLWSGRRNGRRGTVAQRDDLEIVHIPVVAEHRFSWEVPEEENGTVISSGTTRYRHDMHYF